MRDSIGRCRSGFEEVSSLCFFCVLFIMGSWFRLFFVPAVLLVITVMSFCADCSEKGGNVDSKVQFEV